MDRPGVLIDTKGGRRQEGVETAGCKVIGGAPTTLRVTGLMMMMMMMMVMFFSLKKDSRTGGHEVKLVKDQC